jgi:7,8-dihydropterin-6-yl-methyl-4-(beta-D-ribofuranosyl)aminobenzene 5'-phosphate synthase
MLNIWGIIKRDVGVDAPLLQQYPQRFHFTNQMTEILPDVFILTEISQKHPLPKGNRYLYLEHNRKRWLDPFDHELILVIKENGRLVVFTGCSHRGILNMLDSVAQCFPDTPIEAVFGGYHLIGMPLLNNLAGTPQEIQDLGKVLLEYPVKQYYTGHCTGQKAFRLLKPVMGERLKYFPTGCRITTEPPPYPPPF